MYSGAARPSSGRRLGRLGMPSDELRRDGMGGGRLLSEASESDDAPDPATVIADGSEWDFIGANPDGVIPPNDRNLLCLYDRNKNWVERVKRKRPKFFEVEMRQHRPSILWIGCSDARVPANEICDLPPNTIFQHRNVANLVVNTDVNFLAALQYAVDVLEVQHIVVCGHYDCGGIRAAMAKLDHRPPLENWLRNIKDVRRLHKDEVDAVEDPEQKIRKMVELNVMEQTLNVFKTATVQRKRVANYEKAEAGEWKKPFITPRVHAMVYDPQSGALKRLDVKFADVLHDLDDVYTIYEPASKQRRLATEHESAKVLRNMLQAGQDDDTPSSPPPPPSEVPSTSNNSTAVLR
uniref:Carbonic anhydrase n=1 Tax=Chromera velia CCMP2878 TaxID=1169474 RepID=A0A0G4FQH5_9ALVE|eukprot:Cvel_447.t1-p1 / transcript=Cvel_447.t1 / gene=Cvel_447 / organism=Chromera_velia_CCMP2878 / gene_product=Carbonic anhydrase, putative / transcript_product=Carbonic anhydrase, putative / location=Cvel_scaffold14:125490-126889(+) / protein_length=349 / sequence_SO=supercontig / SO=protein_coding / is_pseudo=false